MSKPRPLTPPVDLNKQPARAESRRHRWRETIALQVHAGQHALLRMPAVMHRTGLPRSTIYAWIARGTFPAPIRMVGSRMIVWRAVDIAIWCDLVSQLCQAPDAATLREALERRASDPLLRAQAQGIGGEVAQ